MSNNPIQSQGFQQSYTSRQAMQQPQQRTAAGKACPFCGAINEPEAMFCAQCGQPISKATCPHCGAEVDPDADFCEICHHYIKKTSAPIAAPIWKAMKPTVLSVAVHEEEWFVPPVTR